MQSRYLDISTVYLLHLEPGGDLAGLLLLAAGAGPGEGAVALLQPQLHQRRLVGRHVHVQHSGAAVRQLQHRVDIRYILF